MELEIPILSMTNITVCTNRRLPTTGAMPGEMAKAIWSKPGRGSEVEQQKSESIVIDAHHHRRSSPSIITKVLYREGKGDVFIL